LRKEESINVGPQTFAGLPKLTPRRVAFADERFYAKKNRKNLRKSP